MYEGVELMGWTLFFLVSLVLLAEIADMIASFFRRRLTGGRRLYAGGFNLKPRESALSKHCEHTVKTSGGSWGGPNKVD